MKKHLIFIIPGGVLLFVALVIGIYHIPFVYSHVSWRVDNAFTQIHDTFYPPEKNVFVPQASPNGDLASMVAATIRALTPSATPTCSGAACATATPTCPSAGCASGTPQGTVTATTPPTATPVPTAIPTQVTLTGIVHEYQKMNNCGPTNLAMDLSYWGWTGDQLTTAAFLRPGFKPGTAENKDDKNVMPYEMVNFVQQKTDLSIVYRTGGDITLLKHLIAGGFPVIIEKGFEGIANEGWMGHYEVVSGYDDASSKFIVQDSYLGPDLKVSYDDMTSYWRQFNYPYLVVYPSAREGEVQSILGQQWDATFNEQYTAQKALAETQSTKGRDLFFALFDYGSSLVNLQDYADAATAYDQAYTVYPSISEDKRPWRVTWYQTGPYYAYYYTSRYQDVINLATQTIDSTTEPGLEESFVWRARAEVALGNTTAGIADLKQALVWHPGFGPALSDLATLGVTP